MLRKFVKKIVFTIFKNNQYFKDFYNFLILKNRNHYISSWLNSWENGISLKGDHIPWMNYGIVSFLIKRLPKNLINVFEYGCGYSTLFWSKRCKNVYSVDNDQIWLDKISTILSKNNNIKFFFKDLNDTYVETINEIDQSFDVIVIDGRNRVKCCRAAVKKLTEQGIIILDNSQRTEYKDGVDFIRSQGFKELQFEGVLCPMTYEIEVSSIFYRSNNIFDL